MILWLGMVASLTVGPAEPTASGPAGSPGVAETRPALTPEDVDRLVGQLGHPRFAVREDARRALSRLDPARLPELAKHCRAAGDAEIRYGLQHIIELIFYHRQIEGRQGFLGIRFTSEPSIHDPVSVVPTPGIAVMQVIPGMSADQGGLRVNDVIIAVDGQPVPDDPTAEAFRGVIASRIPGDVVSMRLLRPEAETRTVTLRIETRPAGAALGIEAGLSPLRLGPRVTKIVPDAPAASAGLQVNDTIESVNGRPTAGAGAATVLDDVLGNTPVGATVRFEVRGWRELTLNVPLGARPAQYLDRQDKIAARVAFLRWWREHVGEPVPAPEHEGTLMMRGRGGMPATQESDSAVLP